MNTIRNRNYSSKGLKVICLTLFTAISLNMAASAFAAANSPFADVGPSYWAYGDIMQAYEDGAVGGTGFTGGGQRIYDPNGKVTMSQFIAILTRVFYPELVEFSSEDYAWYAPNYDAADLCGLFNGVPNNAPDTEVTREVMAQIMYNLMEDQINSGADIRMPDAQTLQAVKAKIPDLGNVSSTMRDAVAACYSLGLITGIDNSGSFAPKGIMNRAQTAVIYIRLKDVVENGAGVPSQGNPSVGEPEKPSTSAGTLTNGMPVTEENVLALMEEYKNGKAPGAKAQAAGFTSYMDLAKYDAYNPPYPLGSLGEGAECAKFAFAFFDELFGNLPMKKITDFQTIRPGDLLHFSGHWAIAVTGAFDKGGHFSAMTVDGGSAGEIDWGTISCPLTTGALLEAYTRYPN